MTDPAHDAATGHGGGALRFALTGTEVFRPGTGPFPAYTMAAAGIEDGVMVAFLQGVDPAPDGGIPRTRLTAGQSVTDARAGTFTLLHVTPQVGGLAPGTRPAGAVFEFRPAPGFALDPGLGDA
ncbi:MAG: hypothetical protein ACTHZ5_10080 [Micrococcaceae bacterium]